MKKPASDHEVRPDLSILLTFLFFPSKADPGFPWHLILRLIMVYGVTPLVHEQTMFLFFFIPGMGIARQENPVIPRDGTCLGDGAAVVMVRVMALERTPIIMVWTVTT